MKKNQNINWLSILFIGAAFLSSCKQKQQEVKEDTVVAAPTDTSAIGKRISELSSSLLTDNKNADLYHQRAKLYIQKREMEKAAMDIQKVMQLDTTKAEYFITLSDICLAGNKPRRAKYALEKCYNHASINYKPSHTNYHLDFLQQVILFEKKQNHLL